MMLLKKNETVGQSQHTEREEALLQEEPLLAGDSIKNIGDTMGRLAAAVSIEMATSVVCKAIVLESATRILSALDCMLDALKLPGSVTAYRARGGSITRRAAPSR
jgi:hypothetical protein